MRSGVGRAHAEAVDDDERAWTELVGASGSFKRDFADKDDYLVRSVVKYFKVVSLSVSCVIIAQQVWIIWKLYECLKINVFHNFHDF